MAAMLEITEMLRDSLLFLCIYFFLGLWTKFEQSRYHFDIVVSKFGFKKNHTQSYGILSETRPIEKSFINEYNHVGLPSLAQGLVMFASASIGSLLLETTSIAAKWN